MGRTRVIVIALAMLVAVAGCDDPARPGLDDSTRPGLDDALSQGQDVIPNHYIVVFDDEVTDPPGVARGLARAHGLELRHTYGAALRGFAAVVPPGRVDALRADPRVLYVTPDRMDELFQQQGLPTGIDRIEADLNPRWQSGDDVDVDIAILDTGIDLDHPDLTVFRAVSFAGGNPEDGLGHGTHVAGTAAALNDGSGVVGVAPGARIWSVKVCNNGGNCSRSDIIAGIDYVAAHAEEIEVANMSLGGGGSDDGECGAIIGDAEHVAICNAVDRGVVFVVSAGNRNSDAAGFVPAAYDEVITVSALADFNGRPGGLGPSTCRNDVDDSFANFSNWGADVDVMAPGVCIESAWKDGGYNTISGTSMAAPHVTGAVALLVEGRDRDYNADGTVDGADVVFVRDVLVATGIPQTDACGLFELDDDDASEFPEPIIFANAISLGGDGRCVGEAPASGPDIAVATLIAPDPVDPGATVEIDIRVENAGDQDVGDDITVTLASDNATADPGDDVEIGTQVINGLAAGYSTGLVFSWNTDGLAAGTYTLTASHGFDDGAGDGNDALATSVTLGATMHIGNLDRASTKGSQGGTWRAWARITVHDADEGLLGGATVSGHWDSGFTEEPSCTTDESGTCEVSLDGIPNRDGNVLFTVDAVTDGSGTIQYDATGSHDDDGNSDGTSIRVFFSNSDDYMK